jgi:transcription-repair coupling factor (superfamily II helicase)
LERVDELEAETADRYGHLPEAAKNLYDMVRVRILGERLGAESVEINGIEMIVEFPLEGFSRESLLEIAAKSEGFPVEFVATAKVKLRLALNKITDWREKLAYVEGYLKAATASRELETV